MSTSSRMLSIVFIILVMVAFTEQRPTRTTRRHRTTTTTLSEEFVCPSEDIIATKCMGPKDCLYQNPNNCNTFIQCTVDSGERTGTPVVMPCPAGLKWNDNQKICDWPSSSTCGA